MQGPTAATMRSRRAPLATMVSTVEATMPPSAPFQPAWAAATTRASPSANMTGAQAAGGARQAGQGPHDAIGFRALRKGAVGGHRDAGVDLVAGEQVGGVDAEFAGRPGA